MRSPSAVVIVISNSERNGGRSRSSSKLENRAAKPAARERMHGRERLALGAVGEDAHHPAQRRRQVLDLALRTELHDELVRALEQEVQDRAAGGVRRPPAGPGR